MPSSCLICVLGRKAWKGGRRPCLLEPCPNYRTGSRHKLETHRTRKRAGQWWSVPSYALAAILRHYGGRDLSAGPTRLRLQAPQLFLQPDSHSLECASRDSHLSLGGPRLPISSPELSSGLLEMGIFLGPTLKWGHLSPQLTCGSRSMPGWEGGAELQG